MNMIILSICISTFNRSEKVYNLVREILKYNGNELEVCVSDNCSTDDTKFVLSKIDDSRFHYFENRSNIGAIPNYLEAMSKGKGEYILFSADKDTVLSSSISDLIDFFKENSNVIAGICSLNLSKIKENIFFDSPVDSLTSIGYLSRHPSGYFFKNSILRNLQIIEKYSNVEKVGTFPFEFILADCCMRGKTAIVNIPLCYMETMEDVKKIKSYSYSGNDNNLYFSPFQRYIMFEKYLGHLATLDISKKEKCLIAKWIYSSSLYCATFEYAFMLSNTIICNHYGINSRKVNSLKILILDFEFSYKFVSRCNYSNYLIRIYIVLGAHSDFLKKKISKLK